MTSLICVLFFLSGAAALLFETLWFQQAGLVLGNSIWASSLVMAAFMGGLGIGNGLAARLGRHIQNPIRAYALLEVLIGVTGVALVYGLPMAMPLIAQVLHPFLDEAWLQQFIRLVVAFSLLLLPSTAMGATLPLLVKELFTQDHLFGRVLGRLYGWNTLGAVLGAFVGHSLMMSSLGIRGSAWLAAATNLLAALIAGWLGRKSTQRKTTPTVPNLDAPISPRGLWLLGGAGLCGAIMLALEVVWFRFLLLVVHGTSLAFSTMLAVVLAGIGIGGIGGAALLGRKPDVDRYLPLFACLGGAVIVITYLGFGWMAQQLTHLGVLHRAETLFLSIALMLPSALLSGALFTMIGHAFQREIQGEIRPAGLVTLANTLGAMLGSAIGGFLLLPMLGIEYSLQILACAYMFVAGILWIAGSGSNRLATAAVIISVSFSALYFPTGAMQGYMDRFLTPYTKRGAEVVAIQEGLTETSILLAEPMFGAVASYKLLTNSFSMSTTNEHARRYMKLFVYWPVALHPAPKKALLISYGVGATAQALIDTKGLEVIDIVDVSKDILNYSSTIYPEHDRNPLLDPRVTAHIEDGRHYLETRQQSYDLITGEPPPPKIAGIVSLYTEEYFAALRERLNAGGIVTYWLPVHGLLESDSKAIIRAFCNVFEDCSLWNGASLDWIMVGTRGLKTPVPVKNFVQQWQDPIVSRELRALGVELPEQLGALFIGDSKFLKKLTRETRPLNDDHPGRLSSVVIGPRIAREIYRGWLDPTATKERFAASHWVRKLWPAEIHAKSLDYFRWQPVVVDFLSSELGGPDKFLPILAAIQDETTLQTLPLWVVGTSQRIQELAIRANAAGRKGIRIDLANALGAIAAGDYGKAVNQANGRPPARINRYLRIYAMGQAGMIEAARQLLLTMPKRHRNKAADVFLEDRFGLNASRSL